MQAKNRSVGYLTVLTSIALLAACGQGPSTQSTTNAGRGGTIQAQQTVSGAVYSSTNYQYDRVTSPDGSTTDLCLNGPAPDASGDSVDCNIYAMKEYVWLSGGPAVPAKGMENGDYFFAILDPSGQQNPKDKTEANLSDDYDTWMNRRFHFENGLITAYTPDTDPATADHLFANNRVRAFNYADTPNPGGEYILAVCSLKDGYDAMTPSNCKYDAFKIRTSNPDIPPGDLKSYKATLSGRKYVDANMDGIRSTAESTLAGWNVTVSCPGLTPETYPATTDSTGLWTVTLNNVTSSVTCTVSEEQKTGWLQTGNTTSDASPTYDPATATADSTGVQLNSNKTYTVYMGLKGGPDQNYIGMDFGNVPYSTITGSKRYAGTATPIPGWKVNLYDTSVPRVLLASATTAADGTYTFGNLLPGTYQVEESFPTNNPVNTAWQVYNATPVNYTVTVSVNGITSIDQVTQNTTTTLDAFRNVCTVNPGGKTMGFWSNKNGQNVFNSLTNPTALSTLVALNLVNASGTPFDPAKYTDYRTWLLSATATNMAYMLSAQMSATVLNVRAGFTNGGVYVLTLGNVNYTVNDVINLANTSLGSNPLTVAASDTRTYQNTLKDVLDAVNNSGELKPVFFPQPDWKMCVDPATATWKMGGS